MNNNNVRVPKEMWVGAFRYRVQPAHEALVSDEAYGRTDFRAQVISVDEQVALHQLQDTVLHEALHALSQHYLPHEEQLTEGQTKLLSFGLHQLLRDNPDLITFVLGNK